MSKSIGTARVFAWIFVGLLSATVASADGWYTGVVFTTSDADDVRFATALGTVTSTLEDGMGLGVTVGREIGALRFELEWSTDDLDVNDHLLGGVALPGSTGTVDVNSYLINAAYHFNADGVVSPYLGVGLGMTDVEFDNFGVAPVPQVLQDNDSVFTYQLFAGIEARFSNGWRLFADYRLRTADGLSVTVSPAAGSVGSEIDLETESVSVGARYRF